MTDLVPIRRALVSVSDKTGLVELGRVLAEFGVEILSTGGTAQALGQAGITVKDVAAHTGFPELLDGRLKTLHPVIHGGLLGRRDDAGHVAAMAAHGIQPIDLLVVNLYPFEATVGAGGDFAACIENIDIGGPALIRGAAKNHAFVTVVTEPGDYAALVATMRANAGATGAGLRRRLAAAAYGRTGAYDGAIAAWFGAQVGEPFPRHLAIAGRLKEVLRYGENPHQQAAFYVAPASRARPRPGLATATQIQGKELSYNNLNDTDAAFELVSEFAEPAVAIIKHANPCGVALGADLDTAWRRALACDTVSAYGSIIAVNRPLDGAIAQVIGRPFAEVIIAPDADAAARQALAARRNVRVLLTGGMPDAAAKGMNFRSVAGGLLLQTRDNGRIGPGDIKVVTKRQPSDRELADLLFAFTVAKHVKSNTIVYAKDGATVGIGAGQMSRVDAARIAALKARDAAAAAGLEEPATHGAVAASDAFFPFADGLLATIEAGATAVIQPGGSTRDREVIDAADRHGIAMVFTGMRHFRH